MTDIITSNTRSSGVSAGALSFIVSDEITALRSAAAEKIKAPFKVPTPKEKVKKRPDGFDYVEGSYMDAQTKDYMPLYKYSLLHRSVEYGWITVIVSLEDRLTGNVELGAGASRIHVRSGTELPNFRDIIDLGNNEKAALTQAIKNAQSRFGISADIYGKRDEVSTTQEKEAFEILRNKIKAISLNKATLFTEQWNNLGTGYTEFLNKWEVYVNMNSAEVKLNNQDSSQNATTTKNVL
ncbi:MAG TPA: hypothetical protein VMV86_05175 [Methanosarcinales archaeon]|nr:hypothetical protein [Methanosarcinales archaeon]